MLSRLSGWHALVAIVLLVALAEVLRGMRLVSKLLWTGAAAIAVMAAVREWTD
jgi:hypothetical protein